MRLMLPSLHLCDLFISTCISLSPPPVRRAAGGPAVSALRQLLVEEHSRVFQNPRDPTSTNVTRAFLNYDKDR